MSDTEALVDIDALVDKVARLHGENMAGEELYMQALRESQKEVVKLKKHVKELEATVQKLENDISEAQSNEGSATKPGPDADTVSIKYAAGHYSVNGQFWVNESDILHPPPKDIPNSLDIRRYAVGRDSKDGMAMEVKESFAALGRPELYNKFMSNGSIRKEYCKSVNNYRAQIVKKVRDHKLDILGKKHVQLTEEESKKLLLSEGEDKVLLSPILYPNFDPNPNTFLQTEVLPRVLGCFINGPSSVESTSVSGADGESVSTTESGAPKRFGTRSPLGKLFKVSCVTPSSLALAVVLLHYLVSTDKAFGIKGTSGIRYQENYHMLKKFFIEQWNTPHFVAVRTFFDNRLFEKSSPSSTSGAGTPIAPATSGLDQLNAMAAKWKAPVDGLAQSLTTLAIQDSSGAPDSSGQDANPSESNQPAQTNPTPSNEYEDFTAALEQVPEISDDEVEHACQAVATRRPKARPRAKPRGQEPQPTPETPQGPSGAAEQEVAELADGSTSKPVAQMQVKEKKGKKKAGVATDAGEQETIGETHRPTRSKSHGGSNPPPVVAPAKKRTRQAASRS